MKKEFFAICAAIMIAAGCAKEDKLTPSGLDINWYEIEDSSDPVDHLRYEIYSSTGVPVFCNDTIGSSIRGTDAYGNPVFYYEVLNCNYAITTGNLGVNQKTTYELTWDVDKHMAGLELMRDRVLPRLPKTIAPRSYLLVDILYTNGTGSYKTVTDVYKGMMTTVAGRLDLIIGMSEERKDSLAAAILAEAYADYVVSKFRDDLDEFYNKMTVKSINGINDISLYEHEVKEWKPDNEKMPPYKHYNDYGFLDYNHRNQYEDKKKDYFRWYGPTQRDDVADFLAAVLYGDEDGFMIKWAGYDVIIEKYILMRDILALADQQLK